LAADYQKSANRLDAPRQCALLTHAGPDWAASLDRLRIPDFDKLLVSSPVDAGPNSKQRRLVADYWKASGRSMPRVARLTAPVARGAFTALSWLLSNLPMRAFAPDDIVGALTWLGSSMRPGAASTLLYRFATERSVGTEDNLLVG
jgi:hypothetical protein